MSASVVWTVGVWKTFLDGLLVGMKVSPVMPQLDVAPVSKTVVSVLHLVCMSMDVLYKLLGLQLFNLAAK